MKLGLFYDTETTGLPIWSKPSLDPSQPRIVQLAACLVDLEKNETISSMDVIINPGVNIGEGAAKVHGITNERAEELGVDMNTAIRMFISLWRLSDVRIAHNEGFDARLLRIALFSIIKDQENPLHQGWKDGKAICTMKASNPLTKAEGSIGAKWPKLEEACRILMNREIVNAHSAMPDVLACKDLFFYCVESGEIEL